MIPFGLLAGLLTLWAARELLEVLPGSGRITAFLLCAPVLALPAMAAAWLAHRQRNRAMSPARARGLAILPLVLVPLVYGFVLDTGGWLDLADRLGNGSQFATTGLFVLPLLLAETARLLVETLVRERPPDAGTLLRSVRQRLGFTLILVAVIALLGALLDALAGFPELFAFLSATTIGVTFGALLLLLVFAVALPLVFRLVFWLTPELPEPVGSELRATAAMLDFPARSLLTLRSDLRLFNAMLLGPLRWPRYLVLTDGLLELLDVEALRGVVAHEVGHARAGHPSLMSTFGVVLPLLVAATVQQFDWTPLGSSGQLACGAVAVVGGFWLLRRLAHRFEHEADVLSATALGGAMPCITALQRVGRIVENDPGRSSLMHPSERARVEVLTRWQLDPGFRARFARRGILVRRALGATLAIAAVAAAWSWWVAWPVDRAVYLYQIGAVDQARVAAAGVTDVRGGQWTWWRAFREELDAAIAVGGNRLDTTAALQAAAEAAWRRGVELLVQQGPEVAVPYFEVALRGSNRSPVRQCVLLYCVAVRDGDTERVQRLRAHIRDLPVPPELAGVFTG